MTVLIKTKSIFSAMFLLSALLMVVLVFAPTANASESTDPVPGTPAAVDTGDTGGENSTGETPTESVSPTPTPESTISPEQPDSPDQPVETATPDTFGEESVSSGDVSEANGDVEVAADPVQITLTVWNCDVDPGVADPSTTGSCTPDADVQLTASADDIDLGNLVTDGNGEVVLSLQPASMLKVEQVWSTIESGFAPRGSGKIETVVDTEASLSFINLLTSSTGRFQISSGQCPTLDDPYTKFVVLGPMVRSAANSCEANGYAEFTIIGDGVGGSMAVVTDESGDWRGFLPAGNYTISNNRASADFDVQVDGTTVVVAVDYYSGPRGTLTVERYECSEGETGGVQIDVYYGGGGLPLNESCVPSAANVEIFADADGVAPIVADLGDDGQTTVEIAIGSYLIRDSSGFETTVEVTEAGWTQAIINVVTVSGAVAAQTHFCPDPASNFEDASNPEYWDTECLPGSPGEDIAVVTSSGDVVASAETGGEGSAYFPNLPAGTYALDAGSVCAVFANGADARGGFTVTGGASVRVETFGCAAPAPVDAPPGGGDNNGGGSGDGTNGNGGTGGGEGLGGISNGLPALGDSSQHGLSVGFSIPTAAPASTVPNSSRLYVDTLPATGERTTSPGIDPDFMLIVILSGLLIGGSMVVRRLRLDTA